MIEKSAKIKIADYSKLIISGICLIWVFLKSPLNPLYSDYDVSEMFFVKLSFIYWLEVSFFVIIAVFFVNRGNYKKYLSVLFAAASILYYIFLIPYGFDVTDTGFHLSQQWFAIKGTNSLSINAVAGTNILGGGWLSVFSVPFLIWARLGFCVIQALISVFSYKILVIYFKENMVFVTMSLLTLVLSFWQFYFTINYDNLPLMFLLASLYFLLHAINHSNYKLSLFFSGIFLGLAVLCKITYLTAIIPYWAIIFSSVKSKKDSFRFAIYKSYGLIVIVFAFFVALFLSGGLGNYLYDITNLLTIGFKKQSSELVSLTKNHSFIYLLFIYKEMLVATVKSSIMILLTFVVFLKVESIINNKKLKILFTLLSSWFCYYIIIEPSAARGIVALCIVFFTFFIIFNTKDEIKSYDKPIFISLSIFIISFVGSDLGLSTALRSGAGAIVVSCMLIIVRESKMGICRQDSSKSYLFNIAIIILSVFYIQDTFRPYQDFKYEFLAESFRSPQLIGIKSNKDRVEVVDSLLAYLNNVPDLSNKKVFYAKHSPMYYYLTNTNYSLDSPWDTLNKLEDIKADFERQAPEMIVLPKGSHRNFMWPNENMRWENDGGEIKAKPYYEFYDSFIKENNYIEVYKNSFYTVYQLKFEGGINESSAQQY